MIGVPLATASHGSKSTTLEGLKMSKVGGRSTGQVDPETRPETGQEQLPLWPQLERDYPGVRLPEGCTTCGRQLREKDGSTHCRRCSIRAYWQPGRREGWKGGV